MSNIEPSQFATPGASVDTPDDIEGTSAASGSEGIAEEHDKDAADIVGAETRIVADEDMDWEPDTVYTVGMERVDGGVLYRCNTAHTSGATFSSTGWTAIGGGSGGTTYTEGSGITIADGVIEADVGTTAGTVAAGNDARFTTIAADTQTGTTYTLALDDAGGVVEMNNASANTATVPANATVAFPVGTVIEVCQLGAGQTTIAAASGVTLYTSSSDTTRAQYSTVSLRQRATNVWVLGGDLT